MRAIHLVLAAAFLQNLLTAPASALGDGHSLEAIREAVQSPIPESVIEQARQVDDQILRTGTAPQGMKVSLVTDERLQHVQALVHRVLVAIGENPQGWVVRVLDTDPKIANAFVNGGKYIYVFTGLVDQSRSDGELAVVIGHEIGHSVLKHNIRRNSDLTSTLADLAVIIGQIKSGSGGANAMAIGKALHNGYGRDDEREADAFGVLAAWRAGFDPIKGADFFTRQEQAGDKTSAAETKTLDDYKSQALVVKSQCETWRQQWTNGQIAHTQQNADLVNQRCALYTQAMNSYNAELAQRAANASQASMSDHPGDQERIAAIAAETDWLHGARTLKSMGAYPRAYNVIVALIQTKNPIFAGIRTTGGTSVADSSPSRQSADTVLTAQREAVGAAQADADAAAASVAAIEAERQRIAAARQQEMAVSYQKPKAARAMTPDERRASQF
jgi:predicted Zn-dependent protease